MSDFTKFSDYCLVKGSRKTYVLTSDIGWQIGHRGSEWNLLLRKGTTFDISVPRGLEWAQSPHDKQVLLGAAVHDELLKLGNDLSFSSSEFRRACRALGSSELKSWRLFFATLLFTVLKKRIKSV